MGAHRGPRDRGEVHAASDIGLLDRRIGTLFIADDSKPVERIPTGEELQKRLAEIEVSDGEIMTAAESAWLSVRCRRMGT